MIFFAASLFRMRTASCTSTPGTCTPGKATWLFPAIPKSDESFASFLFWHSILLTFTTPLSRVFKKSWDGKLIVPTMLNYLGIPQFFLGRPADATYLAYAPSAKTDRAFLPHAFFGLLWLLAAYFHICHRQNVRSRAGQRMLGMFAAIAFFGHQICAVRCLTINPMNQHVLPWMMLLSNITVSVAYFLLGTYALIKKDIKAHKSAMMRCFLYSIEGGGTIRTVGAIMHLFGLGPTFCQQVVGGCAAQCVLPYLHRLIWIRLMTTYYIGVHAQIRGHPNNWMMFKSDVVSIVRSYAAICGFFFVVDEPERMLDRVFAPGGDRTFAFILTFVVGSMTLVSPGTQELVELVNESISERTRRHRTYIIKLPSRLMSTGVLSLCKGVNRHWFVEPPAKGETRIEYWRH